MHMKCLLISTMEKALTHVTYVPHHGIYHPHKTGKIRVLFDCSAKFRGVFLKRMLYKSPGLTNSLVGMLTRFREDRFAVMPNIQ